MTTRRACFAILTSLLFLLSSCYTPPTTELPRSVILTADDFGATPGINRGIKAAVEAGVINTVSVMTNFPGAPEAAAELATAHPSVGVGVHLNITSGTPLLSPAEIPTLVGEDGTFFSIADALGRVDSFDLRQLEAELRAQIDALARTGVEIDHLTSQHNLLHLYTPFFEIVVRLAQEYQLPVRSPVPLSVLDPTFANAPIRRNGMTRVSEAISIHGAKVLDLLPYAGIGAMRANRARLDEAGVAHPDTTVGVFWGSPTPETLERIFARLPPGVSEIVFHLGDGASDEDAPPGIDGEYFATRERELSTLLAAPWEHYLVDYNVRIIGFSDLAR